MVPQRAIRATRAQIPPCRVAVWLVSSRLVGREARETTVAQEARQPLAPLPGQRSFLVETAETVLSYRIRLEAVAVVVQGRPVQAVTVPIPAGLFSAEQVVPVARGLLPAGPVATAVIEVRMGLTVPHLAAVVEVRVTLYLAKETVATVQMAP